MSIFQLIASLFAISMLYVVTVHRRRKTLSNTESLLWYTLWSLFILLALFPNILLGITHALTFARVFDLLTVLGMMVLSVVVFACYFQQKESDQKLETFVRQEAMNTTLKTLNMNTSLVKKTQTHPRKNLRNKMKP